VVEREIESPNPQFERKLNSEKGTKEARRCTHRLGQAMDLRASPPRTLKREAGARGHKGPFLPVLIYASREEEFSFEYQHGSIAHGAFTYCLAKTLRRDRRLKKPKLTFDSLVSEVRRELGELGYAQTPALVAPSEIKKQKIPPSVA
jgi:metacaspase-1